MAGKGRNRYASRSEAVFAVIVGLLTAGYTDDVIASVLLDPNNGISAKPRQRGRAWVADEIARAKEKTVTRQDDTIAQKLVEIGQGVEIFHDDRDDPFACVTFGNTKRIVPMRGKLYRSWLARQYHLETGRAPNAQAISSALCVLIGYAVGDAPEVHLHNRLAFHKGVVWLDLADDENRAIRISKGSWRVADTPKVRFRRFAHQAELPTPEEGGDVRELLSFLNMPRKDDELLYLFRVDDSAVMAAQKKSKKMLDLADLG